MKYGISFEDAAKASGKGFRVRRCDSTYVSIDSAGHGSVLTSKGSGGVSVTQVDLTNEDMKYCDWLILRN